MLLSRQTSRGAPSIINRLPQKLLSRRTVIVVQTSTDGRTTGRNAHKGLGPRRAVLAQHGESGVSEHAVTAHRPPARRLSLARNGKQSSTARPAALARHSERTQRIRLI